MVLDKKMISDFSESLARGVKVEDVIHDVCEAMTLKIVMFIHEHIKQLSEAMANVPAEDSALRSRLASEIKALKRMTVMISEAS